MRTAAAPVQQSCRFLLLILGEPILYFVDAYSMCSSSLFPDHKIFQIYNSVWPWTSFAVKIT